MLIKTRNLASNVSIMARIFAISDLHVDITENLRWVTSLSSTAYKQDGLIVAGDVSDDMDLLKNTLETLKHKFASVSYVPGNHEMWIRPKKTEKLVHQDSIEKFHAIIGLCDKIGVHTNPLKVTGSHSNAWIVPLFSWYTQPEEDLENTLYVQGKTEDKELTKMAWMDNHFCKWDSLKETPSKYFEHLNTERVSRSYDAPVISFSHFVPRFDLIPPSQSDLDQVSQERYKMGLQPIIAHQGADVRFNFSRYAGCRSVENQIRKLKSMIHVHGHQHRNRDSMIDGVRYVSFCLGYPRERNMGLMWGLDNAGGPKQIWPSS